MGNCSSEPQVHSSQRRSIPVSKKKSHLGEHPSDEEESSDSQSELNPYDQENADKETFNAKLWESIFQEYGHKLVDPQDVHSILDSALSSTIHKLHSAEMTLVLRRVRKVVKSLLHSPKSIIENGNSSGNNGHEDKRKNSKAIYQKDHLLDEHLVRQIFIAGDRWISRCEKEHTVTKNVKEYHERKRNDHPLKSTISSDDTTMASTSNRHEKVPQKEKQQHKAKAADLIGAAYTIMLYLSESRWDYVANIAKVSAQNAGLNLDVNHRVLQDDQTLDSSSTQKKIQGSSSPDLPPPPPISLTDSNTYDLSNTPVPSKDSGVTIQAISFLIALVLRGNRKQRLVFLFYLLLDPEVLELFLENHPGGGVPSWLLELDQDWALSFAGLGHYLFFEKTLKVCVHQAIETIGILLSYSTSSVDFSSNGANSTLSTNESNFGNRKRALSYGDAKYHAAKMHIMLADYLHDVRTEKDYPTFENESEQKWRLQVLDKFWDASYILYTQSNQKYWSLDEFLSWADAALPTESTIDITMHQIFGMGLLPTPAMERKLVADSWTTWQMKEARHLFHLNASDGYNHDRISAFQDKNALDPNKRSSVWGGIGGFDGRGGLGFGVLYCIDKEWWDHWQRYVRWEWNGEMTDISIESRMRPQELSTEKLLDRLPDSSITGSHGSYELMKKNLKKEKDYVLIPPGVWDILYELYGGGPPLPRMITNPYDESVLNSTSEVCTTPMKIPQALQVLTHPWVLECHVCDPHQPYRRGEAGHMSIRLMASPDQSLSRLFAEIILRLPIVHPRGKDGDGRGRARLWRETNKDTEDDNRNHSSYGPWALLKDQATAEFPVGENIVIDEQNYESFLKSWNEYADHGTLESLGLSDGMKLMFEYALVGKDGKL